MTAVCGVCRGPVPSRFLRCYTCEHNALLVGGLLADAVVPIGYAIKGSQLASDLRRYKWEGDSAAIGRLGAMLAGFLRAHGDCVQRAAGVAGFSRVAIVPSGQGRPGVHPLEAIVASCVALPATRLLATRAVPEHGREVSTEWLRAERALAGENVLVIDDTWVSGANAQSAAVALKRAGVARVAIVVLGRHIDLARHRATPLLAALAGGSSPGTGAPSAHTCARSESAAPSLGEPPEHSQHPRRSGLRALSSRLFIRHLRHLVQLHKAPAGRCLLQYDRLRQDVALGGRMLRIGTITCCALAALSAIGVASCTSSTAATTATPEQSSIVVDSVPAAEEAGLYVAQYEGFFKRAGLTVDIRPITGGEAAISDLQAGSAQFVAGNYVSFILAQIAGKFNGKATSFRIVAAGSEITPGTEVLYTMPGSPYQSVADLARYRASVGLNTTNDIGQVLFGALYAAQGYSFAADARPDIPAQGFPGLLKQLLARQVDAAWLPQPFGTMAEEQGAVQLADFDSGATEDFPFTGYIGSTPWVKSHPKTVAAFVMALTEGQQVADTSRSVAEAAFEKYVHVPKMVADTMPFDTYPLSMDIPQLQRVPDDMLEFGLTPGLRKPYQITGMVQAP